MLSLGSRMRPRTFVFITMMVLCHCIVKGQTLTNAAPPTPAEPGALSSGERDLPDDPGQEILPIAQPEPTPPTGIPVKLSAQRQELVNDTWTLQGQVEIDYRGYVIQADKVSYNRTTTELHADGNLRVTGGPYDISITASHGDMRLNAHTARFYNVSGTMGIHATRKSAVYSTANPFIFSARVLLQTGEGTYRIIDGSMTNCNLPRPDWELLSHSIDVNNSRASTTNTLFKAFGVPVFYIPYLRHPTDETGRQSGFLIPTLSNSSIRGYTVGEQFYWAINRSMDMLVGTEYYSKRGWAPNGDFRYKGAGRDHLTVRWNALLDRGFEELQTTGPQAGQSISINQGGLDLGAVGRKDLSPETRLAGNVEYLSRYVYRLVFNDNYWQAVSSEVKSDISLTHAHNGYVPSVDLSRIQNFASSDEGNEARILRLPSLRFDVLDRPLEGTAMYWGLGSSIAHLGRAEPGLHAHNDGRIDLYPHVSLPLVAGGWSFVPEAALRETSYSTRQNPDLTGVNGGVPTVSHDPINRMDAEASFDMRAPAMVRDFTLGRWDRRLRHVIEPELMYHFVGGIGSLARNVLLVDTNDIATDTNEAGFSLMQRFYLSPAHEVPCTPSQDAACPSKAREWASWQIAQKYYFNPTFGGALIPTRRNVLDATLDLTGVAFLTQPRNLSPVISRMRFEAIDNLRLEWDMDYDTKAGRLGADNLYAGYNWGNTTIGIGHSLLNAVDEQGNTAALIQSQQVEPFLEIGKPSGAGFNMAANGGYDFVHGALQYAGVQAVYNWNCCGVTLGYRRFALGSVRDETQYLYSITLANFGSVGDIRRSNTVFRDPSAPPVY